MSILQSNYLAVGQTSYSSSKYVDVKPEDYQGNWTGQYGDGKKFSFQISDVEGFKAKVKYQSGSTTNYGQVLIKDASFRIGDTKFSLSSNGTAQIATAITDPVSGNVSLAQAVATQGS
ncbi:MAG TPA: hypothetical protein VHA37_03890 [Candidatus Saccharimonadales bacterium]|nr:hypothetical protein [Candidatus Saccharimonadales bacterium]